MRGQEMLDLIGDLDPAYIEAAAENPRLRKSVWRRWAAIAACLCLVIAGTAMWNHFGSQEKTAEGGNGAGNDAPAGVWPEGVDPVIACVAVFPSGEKLRDVADAISISISEKDARAVRNLGAYLPSALPDGYRYAVGGHYRTIMKDGTEYHMLRVTYERGAASVPAPVPENAESASDLTGNTAFLWMVWDHFPDTDRPVYLPDEVSVSIIEQQGGQVFYIDYEGIYVGIEKLDISAEELFAVIESVR